MADESQKHSKPRLLRHAIVGTLALLFFVGVGWYLTSDSFRELIRSRLISQLEDATGGKAEIGRVEWSLSRLYVSLENVTVHGLEGPADAPLLHVNRVVARLRVVSLLEREISFQSLAFDSPAVHLIVYPDGRTNQPSPRAGLSEAPQQGRLAQIFDISVQKFAVNNGVLQTNEQRTPFDFNASDVTAALSYQGRPGFYDVKVNVGKFDAHWTDYRPFAAAGSFEFRLYRDAIEMRSAQISSEKSEFSFDGKLTNFLRPRVALNYKAKLDLQQVGAISRLHDLKSGTLEFSGAARYDETRLTSNGKVQLTNGAWMHPDVHVTGLAGTAIYSLDPDRLQLSQIAAKALGGTVTGEMSVTNWNARPREHPESLAETAKASGHSMVAREQRASAKFSLHDLRAEEIEALFATRRLPLSELRAAAVADGTAELTWLGSAKNSELRLDVRALPKEDVETGHWPITAQFRGMYSFRAHSLQIDRAEVQTPASHVTAIGMWGANQLDLEVGASTTNIREIQPILAANGASDLPVQVAGEASFRGTVQGRNTLPSVAGHLKLTDFTTTLSPTNTIDHQSELVKALHKKGRPARQAQIAPAATSKPVHFHWDTFDGYVSFAPDAASVSGAVLRSGSTRVELAGDTTLQQGMFTDASVFHVTSRIRDARVEDMESLLDVNYPVTGSLNLELQMSGTRLNPQGSGKLTIAAGTAYGQPLQSLSTELTFSGREAGFSNLHVVSDSAIAEGSGSVNVSSEQFHFDVQGSGIDLLRFPLLQTAKVKLTGIAGFTAKGSGTLSMPSINGHARISNVSLGAKREGDLEIDVATQGVILRLTATS